MNYIMNNCGVKFAQEGIYEYIIFNSDKKTKSKIDLTPSQAEQVRQIFSLTVLGPMHVFKMKLNDFREVEIQLNSGQII